MPSSSRLCGFRCSALPSRYWVCRYRRLRPIACSLRPYERRRGPVCIRGHPRGLCGNREPTGPVPGFGEEHRAARLGLGGPVLPWLLEPTAWRGRDHRCPSRGRAPVILSVQYHVAEQEAASALLLSMVFSLVTLSGFIFLT